MYVYVCRYTCIHIYTVYIYIYIYTVFGESFGSTLFPSSKKRSVPTATPFLLAYDSNTLDIAVTGLTLKYSSSPAYICEYVCVCIRLCNSFSK